jgi:hypothetical protein
MVGNSQDERSQEYFRVRQLMLMNKYIRLRFIFQGEIISIYHTI